MPTPEKTSDLDAQRMIDAVDAEMTAANADAEAEKARFKKPLIRRLGQVAAGRNGLENSK